MVIFHKILNILESYVTLNWLIYGAIIFSIAFVIYWLQRISFKKLIEKASKTTYIWDDTLLRALSFPFSVFIWINAFFIFTDYALLDVQQKYFITAIPLTQKGVDILLLIWFLWRYMRKIEYRLMHPMSISDKHPPISVDVTTLSIVGRLVRLALISFGLLTILDAFGIPLAGLLAFGGGSAIVMGIAAQQLLANWFGGLIIFIDKPFKLGDWVQSPDRSIEGNVTRIGWRTTEVMTFDQRPLYIPNALFNQIIIVNPQRMLHRKMDVTLHIRYEDFNKLEDIIKDMRFMIESHEKIAHREVQWVHLVSYESSSLNINIICYISSTNDWRDTQQDILIKLFKIIISHNAQLTFPTVTTHIPNNISILHNQLSNAGANHDRV